MNWPFGRFPLVFICLIGIGEVLSSRDRTASNFSFSTTIFFFMPEW
jgi:hypothetical protein